MRSGGQVVCWGGNYDGQFGNGSTTASTQPAPAFTLVSALGIDIGMGHACALRAARDIVCSGLNANGQLGDTSMADSLDPVAAVGASDIAGVALGPVHSCAHDTAGSVFCWGSNEYGTIGNGENGAGLEVRSPSMVMGITSAVMLTAGKNHNCVRTVDNEMWCWGANSVGQLGDGTTTLRNVPVQTSPP